MSNAIVFPPGCGTRFEKHRVYPSKLIPALRWSEPDSNFDRIDYILVDRTLIIRGDLGDAVFDWPSRRNFHMLANTSIDYFLEKLRSSEWGRFAREWDPDEAFRNAIEYFSMNVDDDDSDFPEELRAPWESLTSDQHFRRTWFYLREVTEDYRDVSADSLYFLKDDIEAACESPEDWQRWVHDNAGCDDLGSIGDCGYRIPVRARLWHIGLKMAVAQLPDDYVLPPGDFFDVEPAPLRTPAEMEEAKS